MVICTERVKEHCFSHVCGGFSLLSGSFFKPIQNMRALVGEYCTLLKCCEATGQLYSINKFEASHSLIKMPAFPDVNL